jgi:hypothetical protein
MPFILIAGTVSEPPKSNPFPSEGRPFASVIIDADDVQDEMPALEALEKGDSVSVQGSLMLVSEKGKLGGIYVVARQIMQLRLRSRNKLPVEKPTLVAHEWRNR